MGIAHAMNSLLDEPDLDSLAALDRRVQGDLTALCYPPRNWIPPRNRSNGCDVLDVVIIGAGMGGLAACFALFRVGIRNLRILDRAEENFEGPWATYARMETLRSPKHLLGPASGLPSLTFRAWYTAQHGEASWERLDKIPRTVWMDYLVWYRQTLSLPIENNVEVDSVVPDGDLLKLTLSGSGTDERQIWTRRVVLATGREGLGEPVLPEFINTVPRGHWAHSSEDIDFAALKGTRVVVIGAGASAVENAAEALEAGAAEVRLLVRRDQMPQINKMMGIGSPGFVAGFPALSDEWRWRYLHYNNVAQTPAPRGSTLRVSRHANSFFHFGVTISYVKKIASGLALTTNDNRRLETDFIILGTGFDVDPMKQPVLEGYADNILQWRDQYTPPAGFEDESLARFPYLNPDFSFREREIGATPWVEKLHCFNYGSKMTLGNVSGDIPAISEGAAWLAREMASNFYGEDIEHHWQHLQNYDTPELWGDEWVPSDLPDF
ncbi:MAG: FAD-dependent urate hydroxylase [Alphaproteobacteria bacterium MarineAlpha4_Bin2]|nr:MAG: FAD-dependent urate hydroxylase [Alphaproteobacteria bacterium MarineAlpha4_Bin2]